MLHAASRTDETTGILQPRRLNPVFIMIQPKKDEGRSPDFEACALLAPVSAFYPTCQTASFISRAAPNAGC
jgi:hypothetical protein